MTAARAAEASEEILSETETVRAIRPAGAPQCVIVEARSGASFLDATPPLLAEIYQVVRRHALALSENTGRCHIATETGPGQPLRIRIAPGQSKRSK